MLACQSTFLLAGFSDLHVLKHLHNVKMRSYCPETFLILYFQCSEAVSELEQKFWDCLSRMCSCWLQHISGIIRCGCSQV